MPSRRAWVTQSTAVTYLDPINNCLGLVTVGQSLPVLSNSYAIVLYWSAGHDHRRLAWSRSGTRATSGTDGVRHSHSGTGSLTRRA